MMLGIKTAAVVVGVCCKTPRYTICLYSGCMDYNNQEYQTYLTERSIG